MRTRGMATVLVFVLSLFSGTVYGGSEGNSNTFYGKDAGSSTLGDDDGCTFIGAAAGYTNTGLYNTFIGRSAGYSNVDAEGNTFIGYGAGVENVASDNTFIGKWAGRFNIDGHSNTFIGIEAGHSNTSGSLNTFIGTEAGKVNTTGNANTFLGYRAGTDNTAGAANTFVGRDAGGSNTVGAHNVFIGVNSGLANEIGSYNTFLGTATGFDSEGSANTFIGYYTGHAATGTGNVFLGYEAGYYEKGSNKLYISNSDTSFPLIYGEFDNNKLTINGNLEVIGPDGGLVRLSDVTTNNTAKGSRMVLNHYSNTEEPVYLFGAYSGPNDSFVAFGGGNPIANAATQMDFFTAPNTTTPTGTPRITIKNNGYIGIGTQSPSHPLQMAGGAYSNGGSWINGSSREYKENIESLKTSEALMTLANLDPVKFNYKADTTEKHIGFIAEDVPDLVATKDRKGLSPMDIVAVLTKVVQKLEAENQELKAGISTLTERLTALEGKGKR